MTDTITVIGTCRCGERVSWDDEASDDARLVCKRCGADLGTLGAFRAKAVEAAKEKVRKMIKDALRF
jgi:hypothetical protein